MKNLQFLALYLFCACAAVVTAETPVRFQIQDVVYDIKGSTLEYPLTKAVFIDRKRVFADRTKLSAYLADLEIRFSNQRVFESSSIDVQYGEIDSAGIVPVSLTVHTVDTWNIIVLPYPKYDSNSGFNFKLKLKDYNFFGSMQVLNGDINYEIDNNQKSTVAANLDFKIPFRAWNYSCNWANDLSIEFPQDEIPQFNARTGFDIAIPVGMTEVKLGLEQSLIVNDRNDSGLYSNDPLYFNDRFFVSVPVVLYNFDYLGNLSWTPSASIGSNWSFTGIDHNNLKGPLVSWGQALGLDRVDWYGNFRTGFSGSLGNSYSYNFHSSNKIGITVDGEFRGFFSVLDRVGLSGRFTGYYKFYSSRSEDSGEKLRGILNKRISSDTAFTLNIDLPVRLMRVNFLEITGVSWTRAIGFEMHVSPFFDMAVTHDKKTGRYYSLGDAWYSGGMEILIYPMKMRSIYGRISAGFDLAEVAANGGKLSGKAERDGSSISELLIGIGLHY